MKGKTKHHGTDDDSKREEKREKREEETGRASLGTTPGDEMRPAASAGWTATARAETREG
ncbi:uncharacterized protein DS421_14g459960 [Arachis hypogaea]|nr:uncharacterized protein DS421_14g459960 [Arachis hypogaea]